MGGCRASRGGCASDGVGCLFAAETNCISWDFSPRYSELEGFPISYRMTAPRRNDRTRAHHSFSVAWLTGRIAANLQLSRSAIDYAVMWGLLHDVAAWPLSHTGEAAFSRTTETDARDLRTMIIVGSHQLSEVFSLHSVIKAASIQHDTLLALFDKQTTGFDADLTVIHKLIHSAMTPDTIEGMHRSGSVFDIALPHLRLFVDAFERDLISGVGVRENRSELIFKFWRKKSDVYSKFINSPRPLQFESTWSQRIQESFARLSLRDTLLLSEDEIICRVLSSPSKRYNGLFKYKYSLSYRIAENMKLKRSFEHSIPVESLSGIFIKGRL